MKVDTKAEMFASHVFESMERSHVRKPLVDRADVEKRVAKKVKELDMFNRYAHDGGRMIEYISDSVCSLYGIEDMKVSSLVEVTNADHLLSESEEDRDDRFMNR